MALEIAPGIREKMLDLLVPTKKEIELQKRIIEQLCRLLRNRADILDVNYAFIEPQGSTGKKQTQLRYDADIDLFVGLDTSDYEETLALDSDKRDRKLGRTLDRLVDTWFQPVLEEVSAEQIQKAYSQHPYLTGEIDGVDIDIVFCFDLSRQEIMESGPITAVDRTPHHTNYVAQKLDDKLRQDVRIFKSFVKAGYGYGDKCAIGRMGITGFTIEVLSIFSGGLIPAIVRFLNLRDMPLDPENRTLEELMKIEGFQDDHLIIIDPTDTNRNAASSFDSRTVKWTNLRIEKLLGDIKEEDSAAIIKQVIEKPIPVSAPPSRIENHAHVSEFKSDENVHYTILRDKLYSLGNKLQYLLEKERTGEKRFGRALFEVYFEEPIYSIAFLVESPNISKKYERRGPPIHLSEAVRNFKESHDRIIEKDGYVWTIEEREWTNASNLIDSSISEKMPEELRRLPEIGDVSRKNLNVLHKYILQIETNFTLDDAEESNE